MAEKIISDEENIVIILTPEEYEIFRSECLNLLNHYEIEKAKMEKIKKILGKLEGVHK